MAIWMSLLDRVGEHDREPSRGCQACGEDAVAEDEIARIGSPGEPNRLGQAWNGCARI